MPTGVYKRTPENTKQYFKKGHHPSNEFKIGHKQSNTGRTHFKKGQKVNLGHKRSEEVKQKKREWMIEHPNRIFKDTKIELSMEAELQRRRINYQKQVPLCKIARVDFYLPEYRIVIQCDGDYWHNLSLVKEKDIRQDKVLTFNGFNVYRFWEYEIKKSAKSCVDRVKFINDKNDRIKNN